MTDEQLQHQEQIINQFTLQAAPFANVAAHSSVMSLDALASACSLSSEDNVLDVACGPGLVACAFAKMAKHVTGTDVVPAMLEQARQRQSREELTNLDWRIADAESLPFENDSFSLVVTRYSFHHLLRPGVVLDEMARVCRPDGRIVICDVTPDEDKADAYDALERLRDPSHVHALPKQEFEALGERAGLSLKLKTGFLLEVGLETQLQASFPVDGGAERIRELARQDVEFDRLNIGAHWRNGEIWYRLPISIFVWQKPGNLA